MVHSTNGEAPEPEGPEEEYPGGDAKPIHNTQKITTIR